MEETGDNQIGGSKQNGYGVHFLLSHSYLVFLFSVILGVIFDIFIPFNLFLNISSQSIGVGLIFIGSIIVYWAQNTSGSYKEGDPKFENKSFFYRGPYKFTRNPTHFGLLIMTLGLALLINSLFSIIFTLIAHILTKFFFVKKQEKILENKYGEVYLEYKRKVKNWI